MQKRENVAKNVANKNSQDLTKKKWRKGELPEGYYYVKDMENMITANAVKAVKEFSMSERIKELVKQNKELEDKCEHLKKQLEVAETILRELAYGYQSRNQYNKLIAKANGYFKE